MLLSEAKTIISKSDGNYFKVEHYFNCFRWIISKFLMLALRMFPSKDQKEKIKRIQIALLALPRLRTSRTRVRLIKPALTSSLFCFIQHLSFWCHGSKYISFCNNPFKGQISPKAQKLDTKAKSIVSVLRNSMHRLF